MLYILGAIVAVCVLWYLFIYPISFWTRLGVQQPPQTLPLLGNAWLYVFNIMKMPIFTQYLYNLFSNERYFGFYNFGKPILVVRDTELLKQITIKDFDHFTDHSPFVEPETDRLWSNGVLNLRGQKWKEMRNAMTPAFSSSKIKNTYLLMLETAKNFMDYFDQKKEELIEVELKNIFSRFANDVIATTAFGVKVDSLKDEDSMFYSMGKRISNITGLNFLRIIIMQAMPGLAKILGLKFLHAKSAQYFQSVVNDAIKYREENHVVRPDMINMLLEARKGEQEKNKHLHGISNDEIAAQSIIFFFAGFDTVSTAMCFGCYELTMNKDIQERLRDEIRQTQQQICNGEIDYDTLMGMKYMDMFVSETLRKWPPFPFTDRVCTKPYRIEPVSNTEKSVLIPHDTEVWIFTYAMHRDPKFWPEPEKFDPERFSPENKANIEPFAYSPFGFGPRLCIGNRFALVEIKAMLFHLLSKYEIVPTEKTPRTIILQNSFTTGSESGFHVGFKRIKN